MSKYLKKIVFICLLSVLVSLWPGNILSQVLTEADVTIYKDIVYSTVDGYELKLDIAVPKYLKAPAPAIVDIPGGAWRSVQKSIDDAVFYATHGFIGVSIIHRTSDIAVFPAAVHDCKTAVRWLRAHAEQYSIDPDKIGVTGFSSGGHLALLLGTSGGDAYLEGKGDYLDFSSSVQAVVDHFGPTDFLKMNDFNLDDFIDHFDEGSPESLFLGGPLKEKTELARLANPINYIDPKDPPTFIGHGEKDGLVIINQSELLYDALTKVGVPTEFVRVKDADHMYRPYKWDADISPTVAEMNQMTIDWFKKWLGIPELDTSAIKSRKTKPDVQSSAETPLYYKLTVDLPGKTENSSLKGRFSIRCKGKILAQGEIQLDDLSTEEGRTFKQDFIITDMEIDGKKIMWNFQGEIFDSHFEENFEFTYMWGANYEPSIEGIGYHFHIDENKKLDIEEKVFKKE